MTSAPHALLAGLVDYAGLFPPAGLPMADAVRLYGAYRASREAWILGRFVVPVHRLHEFAAARTANTDVAGPWPIAALVGQHLGAEFAAVGRFNDAERARGVRCAGVVESCDVKVDDCSAVAHAAAATPPGVGLACEVGPDPMGWPPVLDAIRQAGAVAKLRTGGIVPAAIPSVELVATFIRACGAIGLRFKVTAGLHHAVRGVHHLTYETASPSATMHGFLNVFVAAAMAGQQSPELESVLGETDPGAFRFDASGVWWRSHFVPAAALRAARATLALSFGSCSFEEPVSDLRHLGLPLDAPAAH
ncbi:MAG: hypothetical protein Q7V01_02800 [Vicinamibacterales bacterium]|nr:hypothetical protein [Vicinamibacterales bacterium]